jgi:pyruvate dehydrogenase E2 component (dihydrolipoamide acetyltransferase)
VTARISAITMPKWGIEMTEGTITGWRAQVGERVERGAEILDVETEKIVNAVEAPAGGTLRRILATEGEVQAVGALIGVIADEQASDADIARFIETFVAAKVSFDPESAATPAEPAAPAAGPADEEARVSPIARRVAERLGVDLSKVTGTGRNGRISKEDVERFAAQSGANAPAAATPPGAAAPRAAVPGLSKRVRMSARRGTIARRLSDAKQSIPHYRLDVDVDFGALLERKRALPALPRITVNDLLLRGVALALVQHPMVNAQLDGEEIVQFEDADIAIAVAAEAGLVTPILRGANRKSLPVIAAESRDLIERAHRGALTREEITGGSFTISNLGMHGVTRFDAIINAPQVAILAVGAVSSRPVVRAGAVTAGKIATLTLSSDHRVVDGAVGAAFLGTLRALLENPAAL